MAIMYSEQEQEELPRESRPIPTGATTGPPMALQQAKFFSEWLEGRINLRQIDVAKLVRMDAPDAVVRRAHAEIDALRLVRGVIVEHYVPKKENGKQ